MVVEQVERKPKEPRPASPTPTISPRSAKLGSLAAQTYSSFILPSFVASLAASAAVLNLWAPLGLEVPTWSEPTSNWGASVREVWASCSSSGCKVGSARSFLTARLVWSCSLRALPEVGICEGGRGERLGSAFSGEHARAGCTRPKAGSRSSSRVDLPFVP